MNNKNEVCIGEEYYLQLTAKVNEYDRLKELYERIYNENCILRENHNINDISILDKLNKQKEVLDKIKEWLEEDKSKIIHIKATTEFKKYKDGYKYVEEQE